MADPDYFLYHFGWTIGVVWLVVGLGQIFIGVEAGAVTELARWDLYAWLGAAHFLLGVGWLVWWRVTFRPREASTG